MLQQYFICNNANYTWCASGIHIRTFIINLIYINDLAGVSEEKLFTVLFADDTTILIEGT